MAAQQPYSPYYQSPSQYPPPHHSYPYPQQQQQPSSYSPSPPSGSAHSSYQYMQSQAYPNPAPDFTHHQQHPGPAQPSQDVARQSYQVPTSPPRRPLPDPRYSMRRPITQPLPHPLPDTPDTRNLHRPVSSLSSVSSVASFRRGSEPCIGSPRPLPHPHPPSVIPRSNAVGDLVARSLSPTKNITSPTNGAPPNSYPAEASAPGSSSKFVPHWRRALPSPVLASDRFSSAVVRPLPSPSHSRSSSVQTEPTTVPPQLPPQPSTARAATFPPIVQPPPPSQSQSQSQVPVVRTLRLRGRTIPQPSAAPTYPPPTPNTNTAPSHSERVPPSPVVSTKTTSTATTSDDEDISGHVLLQRNGARSPLPPLRDENEQLEQSPQYGIRDLPMRRAKSDAPAGTSSQVQVQTQPQAQQPMQSATMRFAAMALASEKAAEAAAPTSPSHAMTNGRSGWPSGLPPLPRAPGSSFSSSSAPTPQLPASPSKFDAPKPPPRGQSLAWNRGEGSSTPRSRTFDMSLDDAPPPSLRRSPSPSRTRNTSPVRAPPTTHALPTISTVLPSPPSSPSLSTVSPRTATPGSATSVFTLSAFPAPPSYAVAQPGAFGGSRVGERTRAGAAPWINSSKFAQSPPPLRGATISIPAVDEDEDDRTQARRPSIAVLEEPPPVPRIDVSEGSDGPQIAISVVDVDANAGPQISISVADADAGPSGPQIAVSGPSAPARVLPMIRKGSALACGGCGGTIVGRTVSAMGARWHPGCFRCCVCDELLENLSSYEHDGRAYCHLDYHERFAPKCYHCETAIVDERFITLDDPELGQRTYHEQHFFCAECGDPFLAPAGPGAGLGGRSYVGDGAFGGDGDDVGFTVYKGHPYCESCHVRLRNPKCKRCKKAIRDGARAVEALGGKWCWECFLCASCEKPFDDPSFFQRDGKAYCEHCFSIMIKSEL